MPPAASAVRAIANEASVRYDLATTSDWQLPLPLPASFPAGTSVWDMESVLVVQSLLVFCKTR